MNDLAGDLKAIVGPNGWLEDPADLEPYLTEWRGTWHGRTALLVQPKTTEEVAAIVRCCAAHGAAIVPQGGNTGLCGGAIPDSSGDQVLLSMAKMNRIRAVDPGDYTMIAEAGCILADVQAAAERADRFFALSLAAEGTCQIGGNLSTNAGGTNVLRYGTAREQVLGVEVVLADGRIWNGLRRLRKDTAGYDLKQLFIGSEGTLGIITAAVLKLHPVPENRQVALVAVESPASAVQLLSELRPRLADQMQAFELIPGIALDFVLEHIPGTRLPLDRSAWFVLVDTAQPKGSPPLDEQLVDLLESGIVTDAAIAKNDGERDALWHLRHSISEAQKKEGASLKHDVSVPVADVAGFIEAAERAVTDSVPGSRVVAFGHVGDGNVHFNVSQPPGMDGRAFLELREQLATTVYDVVRRFDGSISAEHGVGVLKREHLRHYRDDIEVELMERLKAALDPQTRLNPGKVL